MSSDVERGRVHAVLDAIAKVRKQKQRPTQERVSSALLNITAQLRRSLQDGTSAPSGGAPLTAVEITQWLELSVKCGAVNRDESNGIVSYRDGKKDEWELAVTKKHGQTKSVESMTPGVGSCSPAGRISTALESRGLIDVELDLPREVGISIHVQCLYKSLVLCLHLC